MKISKLKKGDVVSINVVKKNYGRSYDIDKWWGAKLVLESKKKYTSNIYEEVIVDDNIVQKLYKEKKLVPINERKSKEGRIITVILNLQCVG